MNHQIVVTRQARAFTLIELLIVMAIIGLLADPLFPRMMGQLVAVGEESGALDGMLVKIADRYEAEVRRATRTLLTVLEPALIIAMGSSIGLIVVSMLYAIFSINEIPL